MPTSLFPSGIKPVVFRRTTEGPATLIRLPWTLFVVEQSAPAAFTCNLPPNPAKGDIVDIKDGLGDADVNTITVDGNGKQIDDAATAEITSAYGAASLQYDGEQWRSVGGGGGGGVGPQGPPGTPQWQGDFDQAIADAGGYDVGDAMYFAGDGSYVVASKNFGLEGWEYTYDTLALDGVSAVTTTSAPYVQPSANNPVAVTVVTTDALVVGSAVYVEDGGTYTVTSIDSATQVTLTWLGYDGVSPTTVVDAGARLAASGVRGAAGATGNTGPAGPGGYTIVAGRHETTTPHTNWEFVGARALTLASGTFTLQVVGAAPSGFTLEARLTDLTAGGTAVQTVTTNATTPTLMTAAVVPLSVAERLYAIEMRVSGGTPGVNDKGTVYGASIEVT